MKETAGVAPNSATNKSGFRPLILILSVLLLLQFGLVVMLFAGKSDYKSSAPSAGLLQFEPADLRKVTIETRKSPSELSTVTLKKGKTGWVLPELYDFRADANLVQKLLSGLQEWKKGIPVTITANAAERFKVGASDFEQSITVLDRNNKSCKVYLGTSPAYKSRYVRLSDSNDIYCVESGEYFQIPSQPGEVIDKSYARANIYALKKFSTADFVLSLGKTGWTLTFKGKEQSIEIPVFRTICSLDLDISIKSVLGTKPKPEYGLDKPDLVLNLVGNRDDQITYTFAKIESKDKHGHVLKVSDKDYFLEVDDACVDAIRKLPADLVTASEKFKAEMQKALGKAAGKQKTVQQPTGTDRAENQNAEKQQAYK